MAPLKQLARRLSLVLVLMTTARLVFWLANRQLFPKSGVGEMLGYFAHGARFDLSSLFWVNALLIFLSLLPGFWRKMRGFKLFLRWLWLVPNLVLLALELADAAWFPFNLRRTILTDFRLLRETAGLVPQFLREYWWLFLLLLGFATLLFRSDTRALRSAAAGEGLRPETSRPQASDLRNRLISWSIFLFSIPVWLLAARGGWQPRPISPIMAAQFVNDPRLAPILSNATMNLLNSAQQQFIVEKNWLTDEQLDAAFSLKQNLGHAPADFRPLNVVTIAFEGAGWEYVERGWLPFLDSLSKLSICPKLGYANGTRSIQGNAAIVAGIPALMADPWVFSPYQNNQIGGLAKILRQKGYETAFFHGSNRSSMQLDKLAAVTGFEQSYDRLDFPDQTMFDGSWGIFDRPFYQFFCEKLGAFRQPFYAHFFSLTSHHPYKVEDPFSKRYPEMPPVERSFRYADDALRQFFAAAAKTDWFKNTLFVISADHTGVERAGRFTGLEGKFRIPILFYQAGETEAPPSPFGGGPPRHQRLHIGESRVPFLPPSGGAGGGFLCQQVDILPSVLDWLRYSGDFSCFGKSIFHHNAGEPRVAYVQESGVYQIMDGRYLLTFDGEKPLQLFDYQEDTGCTKNILGENRAIADRLETRLKAIIQRHNRAMVRNQIW